jgi:hypothetical protein
MTAAQPVQFIHPAFARTTPRSDRIAPAQTELTKETGLRPLARYIRQELAKRRLGVDTPFTSC